MSDTTPVRTTTRTTTRNGIRTVRTTTRHGAATFTTTTKTPVEALKPAVEITTHH